MPSFTLKIEIGNIIGSCKSDSVNKIYDVFRCSYAEKSLGIDNYADFYFGCPSNNLCGGEYDGNTVFMVSKDDEAKYFFPKCVYFNPDSNKVVEVR